MEKTYSRLQTDLSKFDNSWYKQPPFFKNLLWFLTNSIFFNSFLPVPISVKSMIMRLFGAKIGKGVVIKPRVNIKYPWLLLVENYVWIGEGVWIDNLVEVQIGESACLSQGAMLLTGNHDYTLSSFDLRVGKIVIEAGAWIGSKAIVCPGVTCKSHSVLTVNSVATKDLEPYSIYQGNPAQFIKERTISK
jgi:putative colanic acid biosynthesis acetyltransferase WcaF